MKSRRNRAKFYCSFCGKDEDEIFTMIAGPCVFICDECVAASNEIVTIKKIEAGVLAVVRRVIVDRT